MHAAVDARRVMSVATGCAGVCLSRPAADTTSGHGSWCKADCVHALLVPSSALSAALCRHGRATFSVLLFQDLAVVVLLMLIPLLAPDPSGASSGGMSKIATVSDTAASSCGQQRQQLCVYGRERGRGGQHVQ